MYSVFDNHLMMAGFPHSDISGSKSVCRLPEAFRRLPRLSSPLTAKASTVCASSLDHITPSNLVTVYNVKTTLAENLHRDRKSVVSGKSGTVRVELGGRRIIKKKK